MMLLQMNFPDFFEGADRHSQLFQVHPSHPVKVYSHVFAWWWAWKVEMLFSCSSLLLQNKLPFTKLSPPAPNNMPL